MKAHTAGTAKDRQNPMARVLTLGAFVILLSLLFTQHSFAAAKAPDIDPSRDQLGNVVYPPGGHPTPAELEEAKKAELAKGKGTHAVRKHPKAKATSEVKDKSDE